MSEFPVYDAFIAEMDGLTIKADDPAAWVVGQCTRAVRRAEMKVNAAAESGRREAQMQRPDGENRPPDLDAKWAARDAVRERHDAIMRASADRERTRLEGVVEAALEDWGDPVGGAPWSDVAKVAIAALKADGVVFAYLGTFDDADESGSSGGSDG